MRNTGVEAEDKLPLPIIGLGAFFKIAGVITPCTPSKAPNDPKHQITRCYRAALSPLTRP